MIYFNLIIIGDEILHGSRADKHFAFFKHLLESRGLRLNQVQYLPDDYTLLVKQLGRSFSDGLPTFVTGGIGSTPDDHTRQAAAEALGLPIARHAKAVPFIEETSLQRGDTLDSAAHIQRLLMADFPEGADLIPNPYNKIAGFSIREHYFFPGFPVMAHPMAEWVLEAYYANSFNTVNNAQRTVWIFNMPEAHIAPIMRDIEARYDNIRSFSLPSVGWIKEDGTAVQPHIEFGIKAVGEACSRIDEAWEEVSGRLKDIGAVTQNHAP